MKSGKWSKIARSVAGLTLAAGLAMLTAGCQIHVKDDSSSDDQAQDGADSDINQSKPTEPDYSMYSPLLQEILKSDYYNDLIAKSVADKQGQGTLKYGFNALKGLPFEYLKRAGEDVETIMTSNVENIGGNSFVIKSNKNELYNHTFINKNQSSKDAYRTVYLLKYILTDDEYRDYAMLIAGQYYQASFFMQEIDKTREPELITKFNINEEDYEELIQRINIRSSLGNNEVTNVFLHPSTMEHMEHIDSDGYMSFILDLDYLTKSKNGFGFGSANVRFPWGCGYKNEIFTFANASIAKVLENSEPEDIRYFDYAFVNNFIKN